MQAMIEEIQADCDHDFRLVKEPELSESLVEGVYVCEIEGMIRSLGRPESETALKLVCMKCSIAKDTDIGQTCPRCLSKMERGKCLGDGSRKEYFVSEYMHYSITLGSCTNCGFTVANDEWDQ